MSSEHVLWRALAEVIRSRIRSGELAPGTQLPAYRQWAQRDDLRHATIPTARKVVEQLADEGWLTTSAGKGVFVVGVPSESADDEAWREDVERRLQVLEERLGITS